MKNIIVHLLLVLLMPAGYLLGFYLGKSESPLQSQGYEAVLSFDDGLTLYFEGKQMDAEQWQSSMETKQDGKIGYKTLQKAVGMNNMDARRFDCE